MKLLGFGYCEALALILRPKGVTNYKFPCTHISTQVHCRFKVVFYWLALLHLLVSVFLRQLGITMICQSKGGTHISPFFFSFVMDEEKFDSASVACHMISVVLFI